MAKLDSGFVTLFDGLTQEDILLMFLFYKNKSSDVELSYLRLQVDHSNVIKKLNAEHQENIRKITKEKDDELKLLSESLKKEIDLLTKKIDKNEKKIKK
jgi:hypothetical protein